MARTVRTHVEEGARWRAASAAPEPRPCVETRQDLLKAIRERYRGGTKDEKLRILDEFVAVTGYHRKHAIRLFKAGSAARGASRRSRLPLYDAAVREALVVLWEASDRVCGKRLKPLLPILVSALERHEHLTLEATVRARVLSASAATLDRLLRPHPRSGLRAAGAPKGYARRATERARAHVRRVGGPRTRRHGGRSREPWGRVQCRELRAHAHADRRGLRVDRVRRARRPRRRAGGGRAGPDAHPHALPPSRV